MEEQKDEYIMTRRNKNYTSAIPFPTNIEMEPIGKIISPYKERHGTPRQSELQSKPSNYVPVEATIALFPEKVPSIALKDMEGFDRIWVIAWLHLNESWNPTVLPPRGPRVRRGTLATRAPHRPNPIGLSSVKLLRIEGYNLIVEGIDLLDNTPVLDIKPYVVYCDSFPNARSGYVDEVEQSGDHEKHVYGAKRTKEE